MTICGCGCGIPTARYAGRSGFARFIRGHQNRVWRRRENAKRTLVQRWCENVSLPADADECWPWKGHIDDQGYGRLKFRGRSLKGHQVAVELFIGPIPMGFEPDHVCRNRACANPEHLEVVPKRENILRGVCPPAKNARKTHCIRGHALEGDNLIRADGHRQCRTCRRATGLRYYYRKKGATK